LRDWNLDLKARVIVNGEPLEIKVTRIGPDTMWLTIRNSNTNRTHEVTLHKESDLLKRLSRSLDFSEAAPLSSLMPRSTAKGVAAEFGGPGEAARLTTSSILHGTYVGYSANGFPDFYRLVWDANGTGICVGLFQDDMTGIYFIDAWDLRNTGQPLKSKLIMGNEPLEITPMAAEHGRIELRVTGLTVLTTQDVVLHRESELLKRMSESMKFLAIKARI
jgi:hypothetical protein